MTHPPSDHLRRLSELVERATPAPWFQGPIVEADEGYQTISVGPYDLEERPGRAHHYEDAICDVHHGEHDGVANAELIVEMCNSLPQLLACITALEEEGSALAAGACTNPGGHGLIGDEWGHFHCSAYRALNEAQQEISEHVRLASQSLSIRQELETRISSLEGALEVLDEIMRPYGLYDCFVSEQHLNPRISEFVETGRKARAALRSMGDK